MPQSKACYESWNLLALYVNAPVCIVERRVLIQASHTISNCLVGTYAAHLRMEAIKK
jgi:hypothetical protein